MIATTEITFSLASLNLSPGSHLIIKDVTWEKYESILEALGEERRIPRINYCDGLLEIMAPLPAHERPHRIIADIVKVFLDSQNRAWEDFGSTTFKKLKRAGLEPDTCFYIENAEKVRSHLRMDMAVDPPPDLAIEADVTSKTTLGAYALIGVPEVWIYDQGDLKIHLLKDKDYIESESSRVFPEINIKKMIPELVQQAFEEGTSQMLRQLRQTLAIG